MKTSADKLREAADCFHTELLKADVGTNEESGSAICEAIYRAAAEILDAMPDEEERLRLAILTGLVAHRGYDSDTSDCHEFATEQARAILAERDGGAR